VKAHYCICKFVMAFAGANDFVSSILGGMFGLQGLLWCSTVVLVLAKYEYSLLVVAMKRGAAILQYFAEAIDLGMVLLLFRYSRLVCFSSSRAIQNCIRPD